MLRLMVETGLGYLTLGQSSPTLSGGEAQRLKLVSELAKGPSPPSRNARTDAPAKNLYILEEPTIGLHQSDTDASLSCFTALVDQGHTVIVIEHNLDLLAEADYLIEIGPRKAANAAAKSFTKAPLPVWQRSKAPPRLRF